MSPILRRMLLLLCTCALLVGVTVRTAVRAAIIDKGTLSLRQAVTATLAPGDEQAYQLTHAADGPLMLRYSTGVTGTLPLELRAGNVDGPVVASVTNGMAQKLLYVANLPAGDYAIVLRHTNSALGAISYSLFADTLLSITPITDPMYLPSGGVTGVYPIALTQPGPLYITVQKPQGVDTIVHLYGSNITGSPLAESVDGYSQAISVAHADPGTYYLVVHTIPTSAPARPCTVTIQRSLPILHAGAALAQQFTTPSEIKLYQVQVSAGNPLYLGMNKERPWGAYIEIRQGSLGGPLVAQFARTQSATTANPDQWLEVPTPATALYIIRVEPFNRAEAIRSPVNYTLTAYQELPTLSHAPTPATFSGTHTVRWYRLPASAGEPLYGFADHNSDLSMRLAIVKDGIAGETVAQANGAKDLIVYLAQAANARYLLRASDSTVPSANIMGERQMPLVTDGSPKTSTLVNGADIHWYQVPVSANENVMLHLDKHSAYTTALPLYYSAPTNTPTSGGTLKGDRIELLSPATATTYFVRVAGEAGAYTLRASRSFQSLQLGQAVDASMAHEGDERWFQVNVPANSPCFMVAEKTKGTDTAIDIYRDVVTSKVGTFGGTTSDYLYLAPRTSATRYIIRKRAPLTNFIADTQERFTADLSLPELTADSTVTGSLAGQYHQRFYQVTMPPGRLLTLKSTLPLVLEEPQTRKQLLIGTDAAVGGLRAPTVAKVTSATPVTQFTVSASTDLRQVARAFYSNWNVEATVDMVKATVSRLKSYPGSNVYLSDDSWTAQSLLEAEGNEYATGWLLLDAATDGDSMQMTWRHAATAVTKTLYLRGSTLRAQVTCQVSTPRPMVFRNALMPPAAQGGAYSYAIPDGPVVSNAYAHTSGVTALYPATTTGLVTPSENWAAFWNASVNEVYGVVLGANQQVGLSTNGAYTVTRVLVPAGTTAFTMYAARPKTDPPYLAIRQLTTQPTLHLEHRTDGGQAPLGTTITHTVVARNSSNTIANNVRVSCPLPNEVIYTPNSASNGGYYSTSNKSITWNLGNLEPGAVLTLTYQYTIDTMTPLGRTLEFAASARSNEQVDPTITRCYVTTTGPTVTHVQPGSVGNAGVVTVTVHGTCLTKDATLSFSQSAQTLPGTIIDINAARTQLRATVNVTNKTDAWNVTVTNPGGGSFTLPNALNVTTDGTSTFWSELHAPRIMRVGMWETITVQYGNTGTCDAPERYLLLYIPTNLYTTGTVRDAQGRTLASSATTNSLAGPLQLWIPRTGPGETHNITVQVQPLSTRDMRATNIYPEITLCAGTLSRSQITMLLQHVSITVLQVADPDKVAVRTLVDEAVTAALTSWSDAPSQPLWSIAHETVMRLKANAALKKYIIDTDAASVEALQTRMVEVLKAGGIGLTSPTQQRQYIPQITNSGAIALKTGPLGVAGMGFLRAGQRFDYTVTAQNPANATASVAEVRITDKIDSSLDITSLQLTEIRIGQKSFTPSGTLPLEYYLDMRPYDDSMVRVNLSYNANERTLTWSFLGTDLVTGERKCFLKPNTSTIAPGGEIMVAFRVNAQTGLPSGRVIRNKAAVVLDTGVPYETNEIVNAIDSGPPTSVVAPLPEVQDDTAITVSWSGQDDANGSGLASFTIYVSVDDGPYTIWKNRVTYTSAVYAGSFGHRYRFYSVAEDMLGQVEAAPSTPDTTIRIGNAVQMKKGLRLVSIPLMPTEADPKQLLEFSENKWACYLPGVGYRTYGNDPEKISWLSPADKVPGRGFWGYWFETKTLEPSGQTVPMTGTYAIPLVAGWNLIGNPWIRPVTWNPQLITVKVGETSQTLASAANAGIIADYAWGWVPNTTNPNTGKYWMIADSSIAAAQTRLEPWQGYWIKANQACELHLPATAIVNAPVKSAPTARTGRLFAEGWQLQLVARDADGEDSFNWFGTGTRDQVARTQRIATPPAGLEPTVELLFQRDADTRAIDLVETSSATPTWRFSVIAPRAGNPITLHWPDITALPSRVGLILVNEDTGERVYMRTQAIYHFTAPEDGHATRFRIETAMRGLLQISMLRQRPTPERGPGALFEYRLTRDARVTAEIRTLAGKLVQRIDNGMVTGETTAALRWNGQSETGHAVGDGMYLLTLTAVDTDGRIMRSTLPCRMTY